MRTSVVSSDSNMEQTFDSESTDLLEVAAVYVSVYAE